MAHGVLKTEHLQDVTINVAPIDISGGTWAVGAAVVIAADRVTIRNADDTVRVDAGQQRYANKRGVKWDYRVSVVVKAQKDDFDAGKLHDILHNYNYFRVTVNRGNATRTYDIKLTEMTSDYDEGNAGSITFEGEQAYA